MHHLERFSTNENVFSLRKRRLFLFMQGHLEKKSFYLRKKLAFSAHAKPTDKRKAFFQHTTATLFHCAQTNVQLQISSTKPYCELAAKQPFSETSQSCVSTKVTLSHRFKSSPAIPGKVAIPGTAGYMMNAGHFSENLESSGDLNRPRSPEVRKPLGYSPFFSYKRKE